MATDENDAEEQLLNILSELANEPPPLSCSDESIVSWLSHHLGDEAPSSNNTTTTSTWLSFLPQIHSLSCQLHPRDVHSVAVQGIVFSNDNDSSQTFVYLCLLLCARALSRCPSPLETSWKRWRSLLCETISLFQRHALNREMDDTAEDEHRQEQEAVVLLWTRHLLPACQHVESALPPHANRIPLEAGIQSVATHLATFSSISHDVRQELLDSVLLLANCRGGRHGNISAPSDLWSHPWRIHHEHKEHEYDGESDVDVYANELWWWTIHADCQDDVAGMDTRWSPEGIAVLAFVAFPQRPHVYAPLYQWHLWFPHVSTLLHTSILDDDFVLSVLDTLVHLLPLHKLEWTTRIMQQQSSLAPSSPIGTMQLLLNRTASGTAVDDKHQAVKSLQLLLLSKYAPTSQVGLISLLLKTCPHVSLKPRLLDLLRPIVSTGAVDSLLMDYVKQLCENHVSQEAGTTSIRNVEHLLEEQVEVYVCILSMIRLRLMLGNDKSTDAIEGLEQLPALYKALVGTLQQEHNVHFRWNLLEHSLQQVVALLEHELH
jgi:hypothetical protein